MILLPPRFMNGIDQDTPEPQDRGEKRDNTTPRNIISIMYAMIRSPQLARMKLCLYPALAPHLGQ